MKRASLILALWVTILGIAHATTFTVSNTNDSGTGSLRQAILSANADATATAASPHQINFTVPNGSTITVLSPFLVITNHIRINGLGVANLTISGGGTSRIFWIQNGTITIQNLTLANGYAKGGDGNGGGMGAGGAIFMHEGKEGGTGSINLSLVNVNLSNNRAVGGNASSNEIGGGGLGGNGGVYIRTFPGFILIQGGGGGVLGNGGGAGGSVTTGGDNTGGTNGGISIFGNGGNRGTVAGNGGFGGGGGGGTEAGNGGFGSGGGGGTGGGHGGFGGGGGGGTSGGSGGFGGGGGTGNSISAGGFGGGNAGGGGMGAGGAIFVASGSLNLTSVNFTNNNATRGTGANNGKGYGGALFVFNKADNGGNAAPGTTNDPSVSMCNVTFNGNTADDDNSTNNNNNNVYASNTSSLNPTGYISSNATTICTGGSIQLSFIPNSGTGPFDIIVNGVTYNDVPSGSVFLTRTEGTHFTGTTSFNLTQITDANNCVISGLAQTTTINVNTVNAGSISGDHMVCAGGDPNNLTSMTNGSGPGTVTYRWESSTTNCSSGFTSIMGATDVTYDPPVGLSQTTYFRRVTISTLNGVACEAISNCVTVTIRNVSGGTVAGTQVACYGGDPTMLSSTGVGSGSGTITYRWESSTTDCNSGFTPIMGATGATYNPPVGITQTTYFRRVTISTLNGFPCEAIAPNCIVIVVLNPQGGTIAGDQTVCSGGNPTAFTSGVAGSGNAGTITYRWERSTTNCNSGFTPIMGATGLTYDPPAVSQTTYFRRVTIATFNGIASGACEAVSNCVTVTVQDNELPTIVCPSGSTTSFGQSEGNTNVISISTFQSFTPLSSGAITSIAIYLNSASSNLTLQVQSGSTCGGTILGSKTFNGVVGFQTITFDTPIPVTGGVQYNFGIIGTISFAAHSAGSYSGGRAYIGGCPGADMIFQNHDLVFTLTMSVPGPVTLNTDPGTCAATYVILDPISDKCTGATWGASFSGNVNGNPANFSNIPDGSNSNSLTFQKGTTNVVLTGMDAVGNLATCSVNVIVTDNQDPTFSCPGNQDVNLNATCQLSVPDLLSGLTGNDNCGTVTFSQSPTAGTLLASSHNQTHTVTITAADGNGNTSTCEGTLTGKDVTDPTITCPATQTLVLGANCTATLPNYTSLATTADNCGVQSVTQSPSAGTNVSGAGNMTVTLTVTDVNGNDTECTFTVTKVDNTAPTITCPATQTLVLGANCTATLPDYNSLATTSDNCGIQSVTQSPSAGTTVSSAGNMTVTLTVTDVNGNETECTFTVTKMDNTPPSINCPAAQTLVLGANCTATLPNYTSLATTGDNCGVQNVTQSPSAGTNVSGAGNMTVTLTVTDVNGNDTECTFTVTKVDNTAPTITCPATQTLVLGANCTASLPNYTSLATTGDNCGVQSVTQSPAAGTTVSEAGNMTVTLTVTDVNGNETECTFTVTKMDNTPPSINCPAAQTLVLGANCTATLPNYTSLATTGDNCGVQSVTQSPAAGTTVSEAGNMTVTLTVTDISGNDTECTFTVTKVDNTAPTITCPATQTLVLGANCTATLPNYTSLATTGDNCGVQSVTQSPSAGTNVSGAGNMTVTLTVTDVNGNETECMFTVTKVDNTAPTITCPATQTLVLGANCTATLPHYTSLATTSDNCGVQSVTQSPSAGTNVSGAGNMTVTLTVTDVNGLTNTCTFTVTKVDNTAPSITCPTTQTLVLGANCTATLPNYTSLATTGDNCGVQSVTQSPSAGTNVSVAGNMTVTLTVTDVNGLTNTCTFTVTKVDNTPPSINCLAAQTLVLGANCTATLPNYTSLATTSDNCGIQSVTQSPSAGTTVSSAGNMTVTLTVTDINGNETECTFTVTKVDNTPPSINCLAAQTLVLGANCTATLPNYTSLATTSDNCGIQSVTQSPSAGTTVSSAGNMTVTLTVTDINGNDTECTFTVTKVDNTPPSITCPAAQTLVLGANCTATLPNYTSLATSSDNCGIQSVTQYPSAGTTVSSASNMTVTLTVTDINGNDTECTFTVTKVDNTPPSITCPAAQTLVLGANCMATLPDYTSLAATADNCGVQSVTQSPTAGTPVSGAGNMTVTLTVTDINGLTNSCTFKVTKIDNTPPVIVCKNTTVFIGNTGTYTFQPADVFNATASSDNCSGALTVTNISPAMVSCAQLNQTIPVTVTVQDASGNAATCTAQITVQEGTALPVGWSSDNVGNGSGSAGYKACSSNGSFTVSANGFSTATSDVLHFTSQQLCGNGEITARITSVSGGGWGGVMIRENLMPGSKKVSLKTQLSSIIRREVRSVTNGAAAILNFNRPQHVWLRLVRDGSTFTGYTSLNGTTWSFAFSATVSMSDCVQVGLFSESINANTTTTATFTDISVTGASSNSLTNGLPDTQLTAEQDEQVRVFPNPTTGEVTIDLDLHAGKPGTIQVFNALGALTMQERLVPGNPETLRLNLGGPAGVYTVVIQLEDQRIVRRVVVDPNGGR